MAGWSYVIYGQLYFHPSTFWAALSQSHCAYNQKFGAPVHSTLLDDFVEAATTDHIHLRKIDHSLAIVGRPAAILAMALNPGTNQYTGHIHSAKACCMVAVNITTRVNKGGQARQMSCLLFRCLCNRPTGFFWRRLFAFIASSKLAIKYLLPSIRILHNACFV